MNKRNELACVSNDLKPDVIIITESWTNQSVGNPYLSIDGYEIFIRCDRTDTTNGIGGGILAYVRNGLTVLCEDDIKCDFNQYSSFKVCQTTFVIVYRSPNSNKTNNDLLCELIEKLPSNCVILGDFNLPGIDWVRSTANRKSQTIYDAISTKCLSQMVNIPTHIKGNVLDLVLTDRPDLILEIDDVGRLGKSDHVILQIKTLVKVKNNKTTELIPDWSKADIDKLKELLDIDWGKEMKDMDTETSWKFFQKRLDIAVEATVPMKLRRSNNKPPWMNKNILRTVRKKRRLWNIYKETENYQRYLDYKKLEKSVTKTIREAKKKLEKKIAGKQNKRFFSSYVRSRTSNRTNIGPLKDQLGKLTGDNQEMANILNTYFSSVFSNEDVNHVPVVDPLPSRSKLTSVAFTEVQILEKIDKLNQASAPGPDKIPARLLKEVKDYVTKPLAIIFNRSMAESSVPDNWRQANVTPIHKKGTKGLAANYRPVSLTSIICKLMESVIRDNLTKHLHENLLIAASQHGFMKHKSCLTNLLEFLETVTSALDDNECMDLIYLDFAKAFDKVPRQRLLAKLRAHGIDGKLLKWCEAWLTDRTQRVVLNGSYSSWAQVLSGVPQGSVLGPVMFIIFINDIDQAVKTISIILKFADDTKVGQHIRSPQDQIALQQALDNLHSWTQTWGMEFNADKCKVMHIGNKNPKYAYHINNFPVKVITEERDIGVIIQDNLKPSRQCSESARKANGVLTQISRSFHFRDRVVLVELYKQYVRPHLEFSVSAWCPWTQVDIDTIEKVQKRMVSMIAGLVGMDYESKLKEVNLTSLADRRIRFDMVETYKIIHGKSHVDRSTWFNLVSEHSSRNTRLTTDPLNIAIKKSRLDLRKHFYTNRVVEKWIALPPELKNSLSISQFKSNYDALSAQ